MKRDDIKTGGVYAYQESRSLRAFYKPCLILDTQVYVKDRRTHQLSPVTGPPRGSRGLSVPSRGLLAVLLDFTADDQDYEGKLARVRELAEVTNLSTVNVDVYLAQSNLMDDDERLGRYALITNMAYLHGDYLQVAARERKEREEAEYQRAQRQEQNARDADSFEQLKTRLEHLGITGTFLRSYRQIGNLYLDDVTRLVELAERGHQPESADES